MGWKMKWQKAVNDTIFVRLGKFLFCCFSSGFWPPRFAAFAVVLAETIKLATIDIIFVWHGKILFCCFTSGLWQLLCFTAPAAIPVGPKNRRCKSFAYLVTYLIPYNCTEKATSRKNSSTKIIGWYCLSVIIIIMPIWIC